MKKITFALPLDQVGHQFAQFIEDFMSDGGHRLGLASPGLHEIHVSLGLLLHVRPQPLNLVRSLEIAGIEDADLDEYHPTEAPAKQAHRAQQRVESETVESVDENDRGAIRRGAKSFAPGCAGNSAASTMLSRFAICLRTPS